MSKQKDICGVRGDLHARIDIANRHLQQVNAGLFTGIFDLGDIEAEYIDVNHSLRSEPNFEELITDTIIRNALDRNGNLTPEGMEALNNTLLSVRVMLEHIKEINRRGIPYRGIKGNSEESWTRIFKKLANTNYQHELAASFENYDNISEAKAEFYSRGNLFSKQEVGDFQPRIGILYLPWKTNMDSLNQAITDLEAFDLEKVIIFSHDYLSMGSIAPEYREDIPQLQTEEQVITALDGVSEMNGEIIGFYGHIGFEYKPTETQFKHKGKTITAYHIDEKGGELIPLDLQVK